MLSWSPALDEHKFSCQNLGRMTIPIGMLANRARTTDPLQDYMDREYISSAASFQMLVCRETKRVVKQPDIRECSAIDAAPQRRWSGMRSIECLSPFAHS